jgi:hypothetical protein
MPFLGSFCRFDDEGGELCPTDGTRLQLFENLVGGQASEWPLLPLLSLAVGRYGTRDGGSFVICQVHARNLAVLARTDASWEYLEPRNQCSNGGSSDGILLEFHGVRLHPAAQKSRRPLVHGNLALVQEGMNEW